MVLSHSLSSMKALECSIQQSQKAEPLQGHFYSDKEWNFKREKQSGVVLKAADVTGLQRDNLQQCVLRFVCMTWELVCLDVAFSELWKVMSLVSD